MDDMVEQYGLISPYFNTIKRGSIQPSNNLTSNPIDNMLWFASQLYTLLSDRYIPLTLTAMLSQDEAIACAWSHTVPWSYYTTTASVLGHLEPSFSVPAQVADPVMLLYPQSGQLTPSTGLFGIEAAISE
jgi:hypothetical protein